MLTPSYRQEVLFFRVSYAIALSKIVPSFIAIVAVAAMAQGVLDLSHLFLFKVVLLFGCGAALVVGLAGRFQVPRSFGAANQVTLARGGLTALVCATIGENVDSSVAWFAVAAGSLALVLDGVDGWLARTAGETTDFGARFDMETDAFFIFGLSVLSWQYGKAGSWILAAGTMRYIFVALGYVFPWLKQGLPKSYRRKVICVAQALSLIVSVVPAVSAPLSALVALSGLMLLTASFAVDVAWLLRAHDADAES